MIVLLIGCLVLGAWELRVWHKQRYPEDITIAFTAFGTAMFLTALMIHGVGQ